PHPEPPYIPARRYEPDSMEYDSETGQMVVKLRPLATIGLALWLLFSLGYGLVRGLATELNGVVISSYRSAVPLDQFLMLWHRRSAREYAIRRPDGSEQRFVVGPICSLLSGTMPATGTRIHKEAWQGPYELNGQTASDFSPICAIYLPGWLLISLAILTIGIMDWATKRDAVR
ncbi:MAG TPA: hypothetical protein VF502_12310, partial [Stellaceae bacterium]